MIVGDQKPLKEIAESLAGFRKVLVLGCGSCVTVCRSGGDAEAHDLARQLDRLQCFSPLPPAFEVQTIERQCEKDLIESFLEVPPDTDAILSLACGVGVQVVSDAFEPLPVIPALNTTFMGGSDEPGVWKEKCRGCGDCLLDYTGGICPLARCAKRLLNGPCGGSQNGSCEVAKDVPCVWAMIYYRLKRQKKLERLGELVQTRDWRAAQGVGPRVRRRPGIEGGVTIEKQLKR
jgi:ferredoxin